MKSVQQEFVRQLIDFAPTEEQQQKGFGETQLEGTVAAYNMIVRNHCAYLAAVGEEGWINVRYRGSERLLPTHDELTELWYNSYFLDSLKSVSKQLRNGN